MDGWGPHTFTARVHCYFEAVGTVQICASRSGRVVCCGRLMGVERAMTKHHITHLAVRFGGCLNLLPMKFDTVGCADLGGPGCCTIGPGCLHVEDLNACMRISSVSAGRFHTRMRCDGVSWGDVDEVNKMGHVLRRCAGAAR